MSDLGAVDIRLSNKVRNRDLQTYIVQLRFPITLSHASTMSCTKGWMRIEYGLLTGCCEEDDGQNFGGFSLVYWMNYTFKALLITGRCSELGESAFSHKPAGSQHIHCTCTVPGVGEEEEKGIAFPWNRLSPWKNSACILWRCEDLGIRMCSFLHVFFAHWSIWIETAHCLCSHQCAHLQILMSVVVIDSY